MCLGNVSIYRKQIERWGLTFRAGEGEGIPPRLASGRLVPLTEYIRAELTELYSGITNLLHPIPLADVLGDECSPDRDKLVWTSAWFDLKSYAT